MPDTPETAAPNMPPQPQTPAQAVLPGVPPPAQPQPPQTIATPDAGEQLKQLMARFEAQSKQIDALTEALAAKDAADKAAKDAADKAAKDAADEEKAKEEGTLDDLLEQRYKDLEAKSKQIEQQQIALALTDAATRAGLSDPRFVQLADTSNVKISNGVVVGAREAIEAMRSQYPALFNAAPGANTMPSSPQSPALSGGPPKPTAPQQVELTEADKKFAATSGWAAFNGRYTFPSTGATKTYEDVWKGQFKPGMLANN